MNKTQLFKKPNLLFYFTISTSIAKENPESKIHNKDLTDIDKKNLIISQTYPNNLDIDKR